MTLVKKADMVRFHESGTFSPLDTHFAFFAADLAETGEKEVFLAAALASSFQRQGHICLDLSAVAGTRLLQNDGDSACPELNDWRLKLEKSTVVGKPGEFKPLILDGKSRLYLHRYWEYQEKLAESIKSRVNGTAGNDLRETANRLNRLFPDSESGEKKNSIGRRLRHFPH